MVKPPAERPFEGQITIQSEISPMASSEYDQGRYVVFRIIRSDYGLATTHSPSEEEVTIARMLDKIIRRSDVVDKESLCIQSGQRVLTASLVHDCSPPKLKWTGLELAAHDSLSGGLWEHAGLCMPGGDCRTETLPTTRGGSSWRRNNRGRYPPTAINSLSNLSAASTDRTSTNAPIDAPHAILPHIRLFSRHIDSGNSGPQSTGATAECRGDIDRAQRSA